MWLPNALITDVEDAVTVFYVDYQTTRYWAEKREKGEPLVFSGWYWAKGPREGGPFKSRSACYRDAWFHVVRRVTPPLLHADALKFERTEQRKKNREGRAA
jgi:hypothetical protein